MLMKFLNTYHIQFVKHLDNLSRETALRHFWIALHKQCDSGLVDQFFETSIQILKVELKQNKLLRAYFLRRWNNGSSTGSRTIFVETLRNNGVSQFSWVKTGQTMNLFAFLRKNH